MSDLFRQKALSLYLQRHLDDPVQWWPWGKEAFNRAKELKRPVFISIGYAACHWCHVMQRESFRDQEIATFLNEKFVPIKVDREERPDVDALYMRACLLLTGNGGWPLSVFATPEGWPFLAGTYFPRSGSRQRPGFLEILQGVSTAWERDRNRLEASARQIARALAPLQKKASNLPNKGIFLQALEALKEAFDWRHGGLKGTPKFAMPSTLYFMALAYRRLARPEALEMLENTLLNLRLGGIYDHLGFGFHRYSLDAAWHVPHFEKMLYDQALISMAYLEAYELTGRPFYAQVAQEIFRYVEENLLLPNGLLASSQDAESQGREGWYYLWSREEVRDILGRELGDLFSQVFNLKTEGNFIDPVKGRRTGRNIIFLRAPLHQLIRELGLNRAQVQALDEAKRRLLEARRQRVPPERDEKIIASWNAMMARSLYRAARILRKKTYLQQAERIMHQLLKDGQPLWHCRAGGKITCSGLLEDYAWVLLALLEAEATTGRPNTIKDALAQEMISRFQKEGLFYLSDGEDLPLLVHEDYDGAVPSPPAAATLALSSLPNFEDPARNSLLADLPLIQLDPLGHTFWLIALAKQI